MRDLSASQFLLQRALRIIPDGSQTASKSPHRFVAASPRYIKEGHGCRVVDVDWNSYIDLAMALGAVVLGYGNEAVEEAVVRQVRNGPLFTLPGQLEVEVAEKLLEHWVPWADMVRFFKTGSEATSAAVRVARAVTDRPFVLTTHTSYHGWADWAMKDPAVGVPKLARQNTLRFMYGALPDKAKQPLSLCAALIMEPAGLGLPPVGYLQELRRICTEHGIVLIFDEILSGIRGNPTDAASLGVEPDLMCLGKAMGNGYPIAAVVGKREVMEHINQAEAFCSGTYGGELVSLAAAKATLEGLRNDENWARGLLHKGGKEYICSIVLALDKCPGAQVRGLPERFVVEFEDGRARDVFQQECMDRGVLWTGSYNLALPHVTDRVVFDRVIEVHREAAGAVRSAAEIEYRGVLRGEPTKQGFRRQG